jgi:hypothetical protein
MYDVRDTSGRELARMADLIAPLVQVLALCEILLASLERVVDELESVDLREELGRMAEGVRIELARLTAELPPLDELLP